MRTWLALVLAIVGVLALNPQAASRQSFLYVASPQTRCAGVWPSEPCPAPELLVYDSQTLGLVTRIPLPTDSAEHTLAFAPDGRKLYAFGNRGTTVVDTATHTATVLPSPGTFNGTRRRGSAVRRDGARLYTGTWNPFVSMISVDLTTGATSTFLDLAHQPDDVAASPIADRLYVTARPFTGPAGLLEVDSHTEQEIRRNTISGGPVVVSPDGTRIYTGTTSENPAGILILDASTLSQVGAFQTPASLRRLFAGSSGKRLYALVSGQQTQVRTFDAQTAQSVALADTIVDGATNLVASEDEARVFVGTSLQNLTSTPTGGVVATYRNSVVVLDGQTLQTIGEVRLPDSSRRLDVPTTPPPPDLIAALATTPAGAPRCTYRVGTTQNAWTVAGGSTTMTLTSPCTWVASSDAPWVRVSQTAGTGSASLTITVDPAVSGSPRVATLTIAGQLVTISQAGFASTAPFGWIDTPGEGAGGISGSLAVTGWALDDAGVTSVRIFRDPVSAETPGVPVFIGHATIVEGARPDVAAAFPTHPLNTRAGWGLNVLTNMLPNQGNGTFRLYVYIDDVDGHTTVLGPRTFTSSNVNVALPFGAIDTPGQGEIVSGTILNFGWALTPQPYLIPLDGSTIDVLIDGVVVGHPTYNNFRGDIAALFPGYQNSNGAVGYFVIDTTQYDNGIHTIAWVVRDNAGNAAGIGSRYFTIQN